MTTVSTGRHVWALWKRIRKWIPLLSFWSRIPRENYSSFFFGTVMLLWGCVTCKQAYTWITPRQHLSHNRHGRCYCFANVLMWEVLCLCSCRKLLTPIVSVWQSPLRSMLISACRKLESRIEQHFSSWCAIQHTFFGGGGCRGHIWQLLKVKQQKMEGG